MRLIALLFTLLIALKGYAADMEEAERWLVLQQQENGAFYSAKQLADELQITAEAVIALDSSDDVGFDKAAAAAFVNANRGSHTEALYWKAIVTSLNGEAAGPYITDLLSYQNPDGGFGSYAGYDSNPLDTAFALKALVATDSAGSSAAGLALSYILQTQNEDGSFSLRNSGTPSLYASAVVAGAVTPFRFNYEISQNIDELTNYLASQVNSESNLLPAWLQALAVTAIRKSTTNQTVYRSASDELALAQSDDGSWDGDTFTTALVIQASKSTDSAMVDNIILQAASLGGRVSDVVTSQPLVGAQIKLTGADDSYNTLTNGQGLFSFASIQPDQYEISVSSEGYATSNGTVNLTAGVRTELGLISLSAVDDSARLYGTVSSQSDGMPLEGSVVTLLQGSDASYTTTSNSGGYYSVLVPEGQYTISVAKDGYSTTSRTVSLSPGSTNLFSPSLVLQGDETIYETTVEGYVLNSTSLAPISGALITVGASTAVADNQGNFVIDSAEGGEQSLTVQAEGYLDLSGSVQLIEGGRNYIGDVLIKEVARNDTTTVRGLIVDSVDGAPVDGAEVSVKALELYTVADSEGRFELTGITSNNFTVDIDAVGYYGATSSITEAVGASVYIETEMQRSDLAGLEFVDLRSATGNVFEAYSEVELDAAFLNVTEDPIAVRLYVKVIDGTGVVLAQYPVNEIPMGGSLEEALVYVEPGVLTEVEVEWYTTNYPAGNYRVVVQAFAPGGNLLAERSEHISILETKRIGGFAGFNPPITQLAANKPVNITADIVNRGNVDLDAQKLTATVTMLNQGFGPVVQRAKVNRVIPEDEIDEGKLVLVNDNGDIYFVDRHGKRLRKKSGDHTTTIIDDLTSPILDAELYNNKLYLLQSNTIIKVDEVGYVSYEQLGMAAEKFAVIDEREYVIRGIAGIFLYSDGSTTKLTGKGINHAGAVLDDNGGILIANRDGRLVRYIDGMIEEVLAYNSTISEFKRTENGTLVGLNALRKEVLKFMDDGDVEPITQGLGRIGSMFVHGNDIYATDVTNERIVKVELNGSVTDLGKSYFGGVKDIAKGEGGLLYVLRVNNDLVSYDSEFEENYVMTLPSGVNEIEVVDSERLIAKTIRTAYLINLGGGFERLDFLSYFRSSTYHEEALYIDSGGRYPIDKFSGDSTTRYIEDGPSVIQNISKIPESEMLMIRDGAELFLIDDLMNYEFLGNMTGWINGIGVYSALSENSAIVQVREAGSYHFAIKTFENGEESSSEIIASIPGFRASNIVAISDTEAVVYGGGEFYRINISGYIELLSDDKFGNYAKVFDISDTGVVYFSSRHDQISKLENGVVDVVANIPGITVSSIDVRDNKLLVGSQHKVFVFEDGDLVGQWDDGVLAQMISPKLVSFRSGKILIENNQLAELRLFEEVLGVFTGFNSVNDMAHYNGDLLVLAGNKIIRHRGGHSFPEVITYLSRNYNRLVVDQNYAILSGGTKLDYYDLRNGEFVAIDYMPEAVNYLFDSRDGHLVSFEMSSRKYKQFEFTTGASHEFYDIQASSKVVVDDSGYVHLYRTPYLYKLDEGHLYQRSSPVHSAKVANYINGDFILSTNSRIYRGSTLEDINLLGVTPNVYENILAIDDSHIIGVGAKSVIVGDFSSEDSNQSYDYDSVVDIESSLAGDVIVSSDTAIARLSLSGELKTIVSNQSGIRSVSLQSQDAIVLKGNKAFTFSFTDSRWTEIEISAVSNQAADFRASYSQGSDVYFIRDHGIFKLTPEVSPSNIIPGEIVYSAELLIDELYLDSDSNYLNFGDWTPKESGDYQVAIDASAATSFVTNTIHVGPKSSAEIALVATETLPGNSTLYGGIVVQGANSYSVTSINPDATAFAASSGTVGRSIVADKSGNVYAGELGRIVKIDPDGTVSDFVVGSLGIRNGMAIDDNEVIYAATANGVLRVYSDGSYDYDFQTPGYPLTLFIDSNNTLYLVTTNGLYVYDDFNEPKFLADISNFYSPQAISVDANGDIYVLSRDHTISKVDRDGGVSDFYTDGTFEFEGVNLISDCSRNILFAPLKDPVVKTRFGEEDKIVQISGDTNLPSLVLDGPLYDRAMADIDVLYYDRFSNRFIIWTDLNSGKIFSFPVICGGIDTDLHVTLRSDVAVDFTSLEPDVVSEKDGLVHLIWKLENVDVKGVNIPAFFELLDMEEGETRPVLESAYIEFQNTFDEENPVRLDLDIPVITAVTRVSMAAQTNKSVYEVDENVFADITLTNSSAGELNGYIEFGVFDTEGRAAYLFEDYPVIDLEVGTSVTFDDSWSTDSSLAGRYVLKAIFYNDRNEKVEEVTAPFEIAVSLPDSVELLSGRISTDKIIYQKGDVATILGSVRNESANVVVDNLSVRIRVSDNAGASILDHVYALSSMAAGSIDQRDLSLSLSSAAAGDYSVAMFVTDRDTNQTQVTEYYTFRVDQGGLAGTGLTATTEISSNFLNKGIPVSCEHTITNIGTVAADNVAIRTFLINSTTEESDAQTVSFISLAEGGAGNVPVDYPTQLLDTGAYVCVLQANIDDQWQTLTSASFTLREDPAFGQLIASVEAANDEYFLGEDVTCLDSLMFDATSGSAAFDFEQRLVVAGSELEVANTITPIELAVGDSQLLSRAYDGGLFAEGTYRCELYANRPGYRKLIGSDEFDVVEAPVQVDADLIKGGRGRLLVLADQPQSCESVKSVDLVTRADVSFDKNDRIIATLADGEGNIVHSEEVKAEDSGRDHKGHNVRFNAEGGIEIHLESHRGKLSAGYGLSLTVEGHHSGKHDWHIPTGCDRSFELHKEHNGITLVDYQWNAKRGHDHDNGISFAENQFLKSMLTEAGWEYTLVYSADDFVTEMHEGDYGVYMILSEKEKLPVVEQKELRERVFAGHGLLVSGDHDRRNYFLGDALGASVHGRHQQAEGLIRDDATVEVFDTSERVGVLVSEGAEVVASYSLLQTQNHSGEHGHKQGQKHGDDRNNHRRHHHEGCDDRMDDEQHGRALANAATMNHYGDGMASYIGFDVLSVATRQDSEYVKTFWLSQLHTVAENAQQADVVAEIPLVISITNEGNQADINATLTLPSDFEVVSPGAFVGAGNQWVLESSLGSVGTESAQIVTTVYVRAAQPMAVGAVSLDVIASGERGTQTTIPVSVDISAPEHDITMADLLRQSEALRSAYWYEPSMWALHSKLKAVEHKLNRGRIELAHDLLILASNTLLDSDHEDAIALRKDMVQFLKAIATEI